MTDPTAVTLAAALAALVETAREAGVDEAVARAEGEALAATIAEPARGAFVDWSAETGRERSAEAFTLAASRGRRYRNAQTPTMAQLALDNHPAAPAYAKALSEVAMAASTLGEPTAQSMGNAAMAASAQLATSAAGPRLDLPPTPRQDVPGVADHFLASVMEQSRIVREKLAALSSTPLLDPTGGGQPGATPPPAPAGPVPPAGGAGEPAYPGQPVQPVQAAPAGQPAAEEPAEPEPEPKTVEELLAELDALVGLTDVKAEIRRQAAVLRVEGLRKAEGLASPTITRHLIFNGNPGTGKTTVARLVAGIYRALGLLSKGQLVEVDRSELVAGYLGQTAMKTADVVKSAVGGVLFIDEAYSLAGDQYGQEAIDTLVKEMEDHRDDLVVIVAGYPLPMAAFIAQNPGLESRFRTTIDFPDYTDAELADIFGVMAKGADYDADEEVLAKITEMISGVERGPTFGNARWIRNQLEAAIGRHAWRLRDVETPTVEQLRTLEAEDFDAPAPPVPPSPTEPVDWQAAEPEQTPDASEEAGPVPAPHDEAAPLEEEQQ
ncbi:AAA family ATPase [Nocardioides sp. SYSU D00038]|uniref:AAA family ATPase n=1 Tax=Nocardioides sp. SYSU D00038 TaxID=2812554 RepID=UPI001967B71A|nr:AAA family ATPase [Nocardioides sp. SYSU D00038]